MKDVVLSKNLPYLRIENGPFGSIIDGGKLANTPDWGSYTDDGNLFVHESTIDVTGLTTIEDMTFFPLSGDVQRPPMSMGLTESLVTEYILVCNAPVDFSGTAMTSNNMPFTLPGQFAIANSFQNIMWGKAWTWTRNQNLIQNFGVAVNTTLCGSGEPSNGDKLYVYRIVRLHAPSGPEGTYVELPSVRLLLSGQVREEAEYQQIMRMRRTYELQQTYDED
jgi:hypothetical protein